MAPLSRFASAAALLCTSAALAAAQLNNPTTVSPTGIVYTLGSGTLATFTPTFPAQTTPAAPSSGTIIDASQYLGSIAQAGSSASAVLSASGQKVSGATSDGVARWRVDGRVWTAVGAVVAGAAVGAGMVMA